MKRVWQRWPGARAVAIPRLLAGIVLSLQAVTASAVDPRLEWQTLESEHFRLHFPTEAEPLARRALTIAERSQARLSQQLHWTPAARTEIVLSDEQDLPNGFASAIPFNHIHIYPAQPDSLRSIPDFDDWLELLITHEYVHTLHLDQGAGLPLQLRSVFGRQPLLFPHQFQPTWLIEGLATYFETDPARGVGRGQSSLFAMQMRMELAQGLKPADQVGLTGVTTWPAGRIPYLYGVHFFQFVEARYGAERAIELVTRYSDNLVPFQVQTNQQLVLGSSGRPLWREFESYLEQRYRPQLETVQAAGVIEGVRLTEHGYGTGAVQVLADGRVFYLRADHSRHPMLMRREPDGTTHALAPVQGSARLHVHSQAGALIAQPEICDNHNLYFDLYRVDLEHGRSRRLTRCGRYRHAAWHPGGESMVAAATEMGRSRLELLDAEGRRQQLLWEGADDEVLGQLDVAPDGSSLVAALWRRGRGWGLERFDLASRRWETLLADGSIVGEPRFSADGGGILFTSDHGGIFNLRRLALADGTVATLSNVLGGAFMPSQGAPDGAIYYLGYHAGGYDLYRLSEPADRPLPAPPPARQSLPEPPAVSAELRPYRPWPSLLPRAWTPDLTLGPDRTEVGVTVLGSDALRLHQYSARVGLETGRQLWTGSLLYGYDQRYHLLAERSHSYQTESERLAAVRRQDRLQARLSLPRLRLGYRLAAHAGTGVRLERDVYLREEFLPRPDTHDSFLGLGLSLDSTHRQPRAVSRSGGRDLRLVAESSALFGGDFDGEVYTLDWREYWSPGGEHVLALRGAVGWGEAAPRRFVLGGFENAEGGLFDRRRYDLRGYPTGGGGLIGRRMQLGGVEWRLPLLRPERGLLAPPVGLRQLSAGLFAEAGAAWDEGSRPDTYRRSVGAELVADTSLFYHLPLTLRLGAAHGLDRGGERQVYLTLGPRF